MGNEMHGFCHQLPIVQENATKPIAWGKLGKLALIFSTLYWCFFPLDYHPMVGILAIKWVGV